MVNGSAGADGAVRPSGRPPRRIQVGVAALLPAILFAAVLVAAPFAGTTTHPLAAGRNAAAVFSTTAPRATVLTSPRPSPTSAAEPLTLVVPRSSVRILVISYVVILLLAGGVIVGAAARLADRRGRRGRR